MPPTPFWAKPKFVLSVIILYLAVHFAIRLVLWPTLTTDDAEQALFAQHFAWSYRYRAPPLFTWMLVALGHVMPVGIVAISLLRYALLGVTYVFAWLGARRLIADPRLAALSVFSFAAIHTFSESSHRELTHTTTLAATIAVAWYVFLRLSASPRLRWYLALGATFGLGLLAKWNFVVLAAALPLACLIRRDFRPLLFTRNAIATAALAGAIALPTVISTLRAGAPAGENVQSVFSTTGRGLGQIAAGTLQLAYTVLVYPEPLLVLLVIVLGFALWRGVLAAWDEPVAARHVDTAFVGLTMAVGLALLWALVPLIGATEFKVRYMYPVLFTLPTWLFMLVERGEPSPRAVALFALLLIVPALQVPIERLRTGLSDDCGLCLERAPFASLAAELAAADYDGGGTILADGVTVGGNLRSAFPQARIVAPGFPVTSWPDPTGNGPCLMAWQETADPASGATPAQFATLTDMLHGDPDAPHRDGEVSAPLHMSDAPLFRMGYRLYEQPVGDCR